MRPDGCALERRPRRDAARGARADAARGDPRGRAARGRAAAVVAGAGAERSASRAASSATPTASSRRRASSSRARARRRSSRACPAGHPSGASREPAARAPRYDLTPTTPDVTLFPLAPLARRGCSRSRAARAPRRSTTGSRAASASCAKRSPTTSAARAAWSPSRSRSSSCRARRRASTCCCASCAARGARAIAVEDPSHTTQHERIRALGLELVPQPVDGHGLVVDGLDADAVLVTPAHQFPTGSVLSGERRRELLAWARAAAA